MESSGRQVTDHSVMSLLEYSSSSVRRHHHTLRDVILAPAPRPAAAAAAAASGVLLLSSDAAVHRRHADDTFSVHADAHSDTTDGHVTVCLEHRDLWQRFNALGTEMVITKSGRYDITAALSSPQRYRLLHVLGLYCLLQALTFES